MSLCYAVLQYTAARYVTGSRLHFASRGMRPPRRATVELAVPPPKQKRGAPRPLVTMT